MSAVEQLPPRLADRTPLDWRDLLLHQLAEQATWVDLYEAYYDGQHPLQFATTKYREAFGTLFNAFADNWCQIVVDAAVERLNVVGFQVGGKPSTQAWDIWQENALDVESVIAHTETGKAGRSYLLVDPNDDGDDGPRITVEHASQMIVATDPGDRRKRLAALKRWVDDSGYQYVTLYLPDLLTKWESSTVTQEGQQIEWVDRSDAPSEVTNEFGVVPVIPLENKPGLLAKAHSDLEPAVPLQNAVNKICTDMIINSEYGSFPQRWITGVDVPKDPETGQPITAVELKATMSRLWTFDKADVKAGALPSTDMNNFVLSIEMLIQHLAAQTRTPPHYLLGKMVNASGDALSVAEAGLVSKCRQKVKFFSDPWEEAMALALSVGGADVKAADCESTWANPERVSVSVQADAEVKKKTLGVPTPVIWLELGYTPEQIVEMTKLAESAAEAALEAAILLAEAQARATIAAAPPQPGSTAVEPATAPGPAAPGEATAKPAAPAAGPPAPQPPAAAGKK